MKKIYAALSIISVVLLGIWKAFTSGQKSKDSEIKAETEEAARDYQNAGSEALIGGLEQEQKVQNEKVTDTASNHFR